MLQAMKKTKYKLILLCSIIYFVSYFARKDFAAVMVEMINTKVIDEMTGGYIGMGLFICYGIGQLVSGYLGDIIKPSRLIFFGLTVTAICNLAMPLVPGGAAMIPIWAVNGFAQAMLWPPIVRILADHLNREEFVRSNLIVTCSAHISTILLYLYIPVCLKYFSWKAVFFSATILSSLAIALLIIALYFVLPEDTIKAPKRKSKQAVSDTSENIEGNYFKILTGAGIFYIFASIIMMGFLRDGIESWLPTLYSAAFNRSANESILVSVSLPIFALISIILITVIHNTKLFKNEALGAMILFGFATLSSLPIILLITKEHIVARFACLILSCLICAFMHGINFLFISCLPGRFARYGKAATTSGFCNAFTYVGAAVSTYGMALISNVFDWRATIISWAIVGGLGVLFTLLAVRSYRRFITNTERTDSNEGRN